MDEQVAIGVLAIVSGGIVAQWLAARIHVPAIILLLAFGFLLGPIFGVLDPSAAAGPALAPLVGLCVAIVVFEGGLALDFRELRVAGEGVVRLTAVALPLNFVLGAVAAHYVGQLAWAPALLFGSILVVTGPTVILPLLRNARLERRSASFLKWEAIVNDPIGAILTAIVLDVLVSFQDPGATLEVGPLILRLVEGLIFASALAVGGAFVVAQAFRRDLVPEPLKTPLLIAGALTAYVLPNLVMTEAGLIGATLFGVALANLGVPGLSELRRFKEALVVLLVSGLFIVLTADLKLAVLERLTWPILLLTVVTLVVVRPLAIWLATLRSDLTVRERILVAWIAPRGIVAAAVAGLAGLQMTRAGYEGAALIQPTVFAVIAATVLAHGFSLAPLARRLGLATSTKADRLAIVGASPWTTDMALALHRGGVPVLLVDTFPGALSTARRQGIPVLQGELLSRHGEEKLLDQPPDRVLAATPDPLYNALVCARLAPETGRERVFQVAPSRAHVVHPETGLTRDYRGKVMGDGSLDFATCAERFDAGWRFRLQPAEEGDSAAGAVLVVRGSGDIAVMSDEHPQFRVGRDDRVLVFAEPEVAPAKQPALAAVPT